MLRLLGRLGKGLATKVGVALVGGGIAVEATAPTVAASFSLDPNIVEALRTIARILELLGGILAAFGIGRKAGYAVNE